MLIRKDFNEIAAVLREVDIPRLHRRKVVEALCELFVENPRFDRRLFKLQCGVYHDGIETIRVIEEQTD